MKPIIFFIYPHPDDESFLTGGSIASLAHGEQALVHLYTLTKGERSRHAARLGITPEELGRRRAGEVREAARILGIHGFTQGGYPDGGLRDLDPRVIERDISARIRELRPDVLVTFDVQGGSVHPDHITMHHVVKRVFVELREELPNLRRLAFTVLPQQRIAHWPRKVFGVADERMHVAMPVQAWRDIEHAAIHAHNSVLGDVRDHNHDNWMLWEEEYFTLFDEHPPTTLRSLTESLAALP